MTFVDSHKNVTMAFCWYHYTGPEVPLATPSDFPKLGESDLPYGVFGQFINGFPDRGSVGLDDEDGGNANGLGGYADGLSLWLHADRNTTYDLVRVH